MGNDYIFVMALTMLLVVLGAAFGAWLVCRTAGLAARRLGLQVHVFPTPQEQPTPGQCNAGDDAGRPDQGQPEQGSAVSDPDAPRGNSALITGRCRGCDLMHIGLIPAFVEVLSPGEYNIPGGTPGVCPRCWVKMNPDKATNVVPRQPGQPLTGDTLLGRPVVANPNLKNEPGNLRFGPPLVGGEGAPEPVELPQDDSDNVKVPPKPSGRTSGHPRPHVTDDQIREAMTPRKDYEEPAGPEREHLPDGIEREGVPAEIRTVKKTTDQPKEMDFLEPPLTDKPASELTDEELERLTRPGVPVDDKPGEQRIRCNKCGGKHGPFRPQFSDGKPSGKYWCQSCVDALGGPGDKAKKKGRKDR